MIVTGRRMLVPLFGAAVLGAGALSGCSGRSDPACTGPADSRAKDRSIEDAGVSRSLRAIEIPSEHALVRHVRVSRMYGTYREDFAVIWLAIPYGGQAPEVWYARMNPAQDKAEQVKLATLTGEGMEDAALRDPAIRVTCSASATACVFWLSLNTNRRPVWAHRFPIDPAPASAMALPAQTEPQIDRRQDWYQGLRVMQQGDDHYATYLLAPSGPRQAYFSMITDDAGTIYGHPAQKAQPEESGQWQSSPDLCWMRPKDGVGGPFVVWTEGGRVHGIWRDHWTEPMQISTAEEPATSARCTSDGDDVVVHWREGVNDFPVFRHFVSGQVDQPDSWKTLPVNAQHNRRESLDLSVALKSRELMLVWESDLDGLVQIKWCRMDLADGSPCVPQTISDGYSAFWTPHVAASDDGYGVVFLGDVDGRRKLFFQYVPRPGP